MTRVNNTIQNALPCMAQDKLLFNPKNSTHLIFELSKMIKYEEFFAKSYEKSQYELICYCSLHHS